MKVFFLLIAMTFLSCQKEEKAPEFKSSNIESKQTPSFLSEDKEEACDTSEMTEDAIVEQAMKPAKANEAGALQGATDCEVD